MSYQKQITHIEGLVALGVAAERAGGKLTESYNGFHRNIVIGDVYIKVDLRNYAGAVHENRPQGGIDAAFFDLGYVRQEGHRDTRKFSKRVNVNSKGVLDVAKLVTAIEKCVAAWNVAVDLDTARNAREDAQDARKARNLEALLESPLVSEGTYGGVKLDDDVLREEIRSIRVDSFGVDITLSSVSPARAIEILNLLNAKSPIVG